VSPYLFFVDYRGSTTGSVAYEKFLAFMVVLVFPYLSLKKQHHKELDFSK